MAHTTSDFSLIESLRGMVNEEVNTGQPSRIIVIGFGMAAAHFAKSFVQSELRHSIQLTIIGEEEHVAYNRVHLSSYIEHKDPSQLLLQTAQWYQEHGIEILTGNAVRSINREQREITLQGEQVHSYDALIFATGSRAARPPISGVEHDNVFFYRTIADLDHFIERAKGKKNAVVIGGGLLGLEAAQVVQSLNLEVSVIERAEFLMPQQLNQVAGETLSQLIKAQDINLYTGVPNTAIEKTEQSNTLSITIGEEESIETDLVIVSTGITPNSELAASCHLEVGIRGGIVVNNHLQTSDPRVFAIGECALVHGRTYGLVAPSNSMAEYLLSHWEGKTTQEFPIPDVSTRLKMLGVDVVVLGNVFDQGKSYEYQQDGLYRLLSVSSKGILLGCLGIGNWEESSHIHALIKEQGKISRADLKQFTKEGSFLDPEQSQLSNWSPSSIICQCNTVTKEDLVNELEACARCPNQLAEKTGASQMCGSCRPLLEELCGLSPQRIGMVPKVKVILAGSTIALLICTVCLSLPGAPLGDSVESSWYKFSTLWREFLYKQISGYTLLALFTIGLALSLRKRISSLSWGSISAWRIFHSSFGILALFALFLHTGFHFGDNLNFWLMFIFVMTNLFGGMLGIICSLEFSKKSNIAVRARIWKRPLLLLHIITFWPLPILIGFHIFSVYGF